MQNPQQHHTTSSNGQTGFGRRSCLFGRLCLQPPVLQKRQRRAGRGNRLLYLVCTPVAEIVCRRRRRKCPRRPTPWMSGRAPKICLSHPLCSEEGRCAGNNQPIKQPNNQPTNQPTSQPANQTTKQPTSQPAREPDLRKKKYSPRKKDTPHPWRKHQRGLGRKLGSDILCLLALNALSWPARF